MEYVIENPTSGPYAIDFMRCMHRRFGARAVCFYTASDYQPVSAQKHPELFSKEMVAANYRVPPDALEPFIVHLRRHHKIAAVIPHSELRLETAIHIAEGLELDWVQPEIMRRFRNKAALKAHLRGTDPGLRINHTQLVCSPDEVTTAVRRRGLVRFVLKPNDGSANINVGFFSADDPPALIESYWRRIGADVLLLEELIAGREYYCNGQVDAAGNITVIDIGETHYAENAQSGVVNFGSTQVRYTDPEFAAIAGYTSRVIRASGLRRSPFHAELRMDESGPSLLECAARIVGGDWSRFTRIMHGGRCDMVDLAAHYYGSTRDYGDPGVDWVQYDRLLMTEVRGVSHGTGQIRVLEGVAEVERMPQFLDWTQRPCVGQRLTNTNSLLTAAYIAVVQCRSQAESLALAQTIRETIRWNSRRLSLPELVNFGWSRGTAFLQWKLAQRRRGSMRFFDDCFSSADAHLVDP